MSYSFRLLAASKAEAKEQVVEQYDQAVNGQPVHEIDRDGAQTAVQAFIDMVAEPRDGYVLDVQVHGSVSTERNDHSTRCTGANLGIGVFERLKEHAGA
jgi:hypothetical protein